MPGDEMPGDEMPGDGPRRRGRQPHTQPSRASVLVAVGITLLAVAIVTMDVHLGPDLSVTLDLTDDPLDVALAGASLVGCVVLVLWLALDRLRQGRR